MKRPTTVLNFQNTLEDENRGIELQYTQDKDVVKKTCSVFMTISSIQGCKI